MPRGNHAQSIASNGDQKEDKTLSERALEQWRPRRDKSACISRASLFTGLEWTGLDWSGLDWTGLDWTGLTLKCLFQCRTEAKHTYASLLESVEVKGHVHI